MPVGRSDGCRSTTWCHETCAMVKTRPDQRSTDAGSISRTALTQTAQNRLRRGALYTYSIPLTSWGKSEPVRPTDPMPRTARKKMSRKRPTDRPSAARSAAIFLSRKRPTDRPSAARSAAIF